MIIIAAMSENGVIGKNGSLPWDVPEEYEWFLESIRGQTAIMGRHAYELFGDDLTCRHAIVVSRSNVSFESAHVAHSLDAACRLAESLGFEVYCTGGESIFHEAIDLADRLEVSTIKGNYDGDRLFPEIDPATWQVDASDECEYFVLRSYQRVGG